MKKNLKLLLGLIILVSITTSVYAGTLPVKTAHNMMKLSSNKFSKLKNTDDISYMFLFDAVGGANGYYNVTIYFGVYDSTNETVTFQSCPQNISISSTYLSGTFPAGYSSINIGSLYFGSSAPLNIPVTTSPTSISGIPVDQGVYNVSELAFLPH